MNRKKSGKTQEKEDPSTKTSSSSAEENGSPAEEPVSEQDAGTTENEQPSSEGNNNDNLNAELQEAKDKYIRLSAEFDNFRKRTLREKADLIKYGSQDVLKDILPLVDDFERAIQSTESSKDIEAVRAGLKLVHMKMKEFLKEKGVHEIEAIGQELDTDVHEAITKTPAKDESMKGKIVDVVEKGYKLNDKVIRYAKVVIGE